MDTALGNKRRRWSALREWSLQRRESEMAQELYREEVKSQVKHKNVLHMIGSAHIDPVWLWQWQEGFHEVKATFRSALDRMNEYEDFIFVASSAAFYEWVEKSDPPMFEEIARRIAQGRWQVVGGWW